LRPARKSEESWTHAPGHDLEEHLAGLRNEVCVLREVGLGLDQALGRQCDRLGLTALDTGKNVGYYLAIRGSDTNLYSILTRTTDIVSSTNIYAVLSYYSAEEAKTSLMDFVQDNKVAVVAVADAAIALLVVIVAQ
jgi:hypothetical protein